MSVTASLDTYKEYDRISELESTMTMQFNEIEKMIIERNKQNHSQVRFHSTGRDEMTKPSVRVNELEAQLAHIVKKNKKLRHELRGYRSFPMPYYLT